MTRKIKNKLLFLLTLILAINLTLFNPRPLVAMNNLDTDLLEKVSKDYAKKFCNGIAFGLSKDSAMKFAIKENFMTFEKKKGINSLSDELKANKIANLVFDNCGYKLNLIDNNGIEEFQKQYLLMNKEFLN